MNKKVTQRIDEKIRHCHSTNLHHHLTQTDITRMPSLEMCIFQHVIFETIFGFIMIFTFDLLISKCNVICSSLS